MKAARPAVAQPDTTTVAPVPVVRPLTVAVGPGHWQSLALLEDTAGIRQTLTAYELATGHPVYLRPTGKGLTVISLDPSTPAMVGVGGAGNCCIGAVPPSGDVVEAATHAFRTKVGAMVRKSVEERYAVKRIRAALATGLDLDQGLVFLHQEWRFSSSDKIVILAVDDSTGQLVVIEVKRSEAAALRERDGKGRTAAEQAASYAAQLSAHAGELVPFFQRLATALARIYRPDRKDLWVNAAIPPRGEIWWPEGHQRQPSEGGRPAIP